MALRGQHCRERLDSAIAVTLDDFRSRFPILRERVYVNSCSQGALSTDVEQALGSFVESWHAHGSPWDRWVAEVERLRGVFAFAVGAYTDEIAVMPSASAAIAAVATALDIRRRAAPRSFSDASSFRRWRTSGSHRSVAAPRSPGPTPPAIRFPSKPTPRGSTTRRSSCRRRTSASGMVIAWTFRGLCRSLTSAALS